MKKVFFVYGIRHLYKGSMESSTSVSACTYDHYSDAESSMSYKCDCLRKAGFVIVMAQIFKKVIEL